MNKTISPKRRAFAVLAAIVVLTILGSLVFMAAGTVQFTFGFTQARNSQQRLALATTEAGNLLASSPQLLGSIHTGGPVEILHGIPGATDEQVSASLLNLAELPDATRLFGTREGDRLVLLSAAFVPERRSSRTSIYLINDSKMRPAPILIREVAR